MPLNAAGEVRVTWSRPTLGPGQRITGYSVQYRRRGTISYTTHSVPGSTTTSYTITNLNLGTVYEVRVASVGPLGLSGYCCGSGKQVTTYNSECKAQSVFQNYSFYFFIVVLYISSTNYVTHSCPLGLGGYCCGRGKKVTTYSSECMVQEKECIHKICKQMAIVVHV